MAWLLPSIHLYYYLVTFSVTTVTQTAATVLKPVLLQINCGIHIEIFKCLIGRVLIFPSPCKSGVVDLLAFSGNNADKSWLIFVLPWHMAIMSCSLISTELMHVSKYLCPISIQAIASATGDTLNSWSHRNARKFSFTAVCLCACLIATCLPFNHIMNYWGRSRK